MIKQQTTRIEKFVNKAIRTDRQKAFYSHVVLSCMKYILPVIDGARVFA